MKPEELFKYAAAANRSVSVGSLVFCTPAKQRGRVDHVLPNGSIMLTLEDGSTAGPYRPTDVFHVEN